MKIVLAIQQQPDLFRVLALPQEVLSNALDPLDVAAVARNGDVLFHLPLVLMEESAMWTHAEWDEYSQNSFHICYEEDVNPYPYLAFTTLEQVQLWMEAWNLAFKYEGEPHLGQKCLGLECVGLLLVPSSESPTYVGTTYKAESFFGKKGEEGIKVDDRLFDKLLEKAREIVD